MDSSRAVIPHILGLKSVNSEGRLPNTAFQHRYRPRREPTAVGEFPQGDLSKTLGIGWIDEHQVKHWPIRAGFHPKIGGVAAVDTSLAEQPPKIFDIVADRATRRDIGFYEQAEGCAA